MSSNIKQSSEETPKKLKKETILIIILCILLVVALLLPSGDKLTSLFSTTSSVTSSDFATKTENDLINLLKNVSNVGNVDVMVTLSTSEKEILAKNIEVIEENGVSKSVETVVMVNGKPYVLGVENPKILSVIVVCDGADNVSVKMLIKEIVSSALAVPNENIKIYKRK